MLVSFPQWRLIRGKRPKCKGILSVITQVSLKSLFM
jgi:hypothetical protein